MKGGRAYRLLGVGRIREVEFGVDVYISNVE